jgi:hypothetical protein
LSVLARAGNAFYQLLQSVEQIDVYPAALRDSIAERLISPSFPEPDCPAKITPS